MSKIFKRITAVFLSFLIMFWAVPNITEWAPLNDVSMAGEDDESDVNVYDDLEEDWDDNVVCAVGYTFYRGTGELIVYRDYYLEELYAIANEYDFSLNYDVKKITFRNGSRIVYGDDNSSDLFPNFYFLQSVDMSKADTSEFEYTDNMFLNCTYLKDVKLPIFNNDMTSAKGMFKGCQSLKTIDLSNYNASNLKNTEEMFDGCKNLTTIKVNDTWNNLNITSSTNMFNNCTKLVGGNGTVYDASHTDAEYARIDTPDTKGYLNPSGKTVVRSLGVLTLKGEVVKNEVRAYSSDSTVKKVVAEKGTVLPADCSEMFAYFEAVSIDLSQADSSNVTNTEQMFSQCKNLTELNLSGFNTSKVISLSSMFLGCNSLKSLDLSSFDTSNVTNMSCMFYDCRVCETLDLSNFNTSNVTNMRGMFEDCNKLQTLDLSSFDTSKVTHMYSMFYGCSQLQSLDLSSFDTSKVTYMSNMFDYCDTLQSLDISSFDTSNVTIMSCMFYECYDLQSLDSSNFDTSNVTNMSSMFYYCKNLQSLDLSSFDTSKVTNMYSMFEHCDNLQSLDLSNFDTSNVTYMERMFNYCYNLQSLDLSSFDTSKVKYMEKMFYGDSLLKTIIVGDKWNTSKVNSSNNMFLYCRRLVGGNGTVYNSAYTNAEYARIDTPETPGYLSLELPAEPLSDYTAVLSGDTLTLKGNVVKADVQDYVNNSYVKKVVAEKGAVLPAYCSDMFNNFKATSIDLSQADSSNVITTNGMFYNCNNLVELNLSGFNTSKVISMSNMFAGCGKLKTLDLSSFDTSKVPKMAGLFYGCSNLTDLDISSFDTSKVTDMNKMFAYCRSLKTLDLSNFNTSNVTNMSSMFGDCSSLQSLDMSNFDTSNVTNMSCMFANCVSLQSLDLSSFDTSNVTNMTNMFYEDSLLKTIIVGDKWNTSNVNDSSNMFLRCISLVGGNGTKYYGSHIDKRYALIDTPDTPGYFTLPDKILYGDANCSGDVRMNDAVLIMLVLANGDAFDVGGTDKLAITEKGRINADCYHPGSGLTNMDATAIQKYLIGKNALPE